MTTFEYTPPDDDENHVYVRVDDLFDISILRTREGLTVNVYEAGDEGIEVLGALAVEEDSLPRNRAP